MEIEVLARQEEINFSPENIFEEVAQNVRTICTTPKYSVPRHRKQWRQYRQKLYRRCGNMNLAARLRKFSLTVILAED